jgi:thymidylate synthase
MNTQEFLKYYKELNQKLIDEDFVVDKSGVKIVELIAPRFVLNPIEEIVNLGCRETNQKYLIQEHDWYNSKSLDISMVKHVKIWRECADTNEEINSNYGHLVFGRGNFNQFDNCLKTLSNHKESRQGIIIYNRPSIHYESNSFDCHDFICTMFQQFFIRKNRLECVTSMRSNDCIFGTLNDVPWFHHVIKKMHEELAMIYLELELGNHIFIPNSWHCYERHFDLLRDIVKNE